MGEEFDFYLRFTKPLVLNLSTPNDRVLAAAWIQKLRNEQSGNEKIRTDYLKLLLFVLQRKRLVGPFAENPKDYGNLAELPGGSKKLQEVAKTLIEAEEIENKERSKKVQGGTGDFPPYSTEYSADLLEYAAAQDIPNFGVHAYYAISKQPLPNWSNPEKGIFPKTVASATHGTSMASSNVSVSPSAPSMGTPKSKKRSTSRSPSPRQEEAGKGSPRPPKKKVTLGGTRTISPLGVTSPADDRQPPTWGSNLIEVSEPPESKYGTEDEPIKRSPKSSMGAQNLDAFKEMIQDYLKDETSTSRRSSRSPRDVSSSSIPSRTSPLSQTGDSSASSLAYRTAMSPEFRQSPHQTPPASKRSLRELGLEDLDFGDQSERDVESDDMFSGSAYGRGASPQKPPRSPITPGSASAQDIIDDANRALSEIPEEYAYSDDEGAGTPYLTAGMSQLQMQEQSEDDVWDMSENELDEAELSMSEHQKRLQDVVADITGQKAEAPALAGIPVTTPRRSPSPRRLVTPSRFDQTIMSEEEPEYFSPDVQVSPRSPRTPTDPYGLPAYKPQQPRKPAPLSPKTPIQVKELNEIMAEVEAATGGNLGDINVGDYSELPPRTPMNFTEWMSPPKSARQYPQTPSKRTSPQFARTPTTHATPKMDFMNDLEMHVPPAGYYDSPEKTPPLAPPQPFAFEDEYPEAAYDTFDVQGEGIEDMDEHDASPPIRDMLALHDYTQQFFEPERPQMMNQLVAPISGKRKTMSRQSRPPRVSPISESPERSPPQKLLPSPVARPVKFSPMDVEKYSVTPPRTPSARFPTTPSAFATPGTLNRRQEEFIKKVVEPQRQEIIERVSRLTAEVDGARSPELPTRFGESPERTPFVYEDRDISFDSPKEADYSYRDMPSWSSEGSPLQPVPRGEQKSFYDIPCWSPEGSPMQQSPRSEQVIKVEEVEEIFPSEYESFVSPYTPQPRSPEPQTSRNRRYSPPLPPVDDYSPLADISAEYPLSPPKFAPITREERRIRSPISPPIDKEALTRELLMTQRVPYDKPRTKMHKFQELSPIAEPEDEFQELHRVLRQHKSSYQPQTEGSSLHQPYQEGRTRPIPDKRSRRPPMPTVIEPIEYPDSPKSTRPALQQGRGRQRRLDRKLVSKRKIDFYAPHEGQTSYATTHIDYPDDLMGTAVAGVVPERSDVCFGGENSYGLPSPIHARETFGWQTPPHLQRQHTPEDFGRQWGVPRGRDALAYQTPPILAPYGSPQEYTAESFPPRGRYPSAQFTTERMPSHRPGYSSKSTRHKTQKGGMIKEVEETEEYSDVNSSVFDMKSEPSPYPDTSDVNSSIFNTRPELSRYPETSDINSSVFDKSHSPEFQFSGDTTAYSPATPRSVRTPGIVSFDSPRTPEREDIWSSRRAELIDSIAADLAHAGSPLSPEMVDMLEDLKRAPLNPPTRRPVSMYGYGERPSKEIPRWAPVPRLPQVLDEDEPDVPYENWPGRFQYTENALATQPRQYRMPPSQVPRPPPPPSPPRRVPTLNERYELPEVVTPRDISKSYMGAQRLLTPPTPTPPPPCAPCQSTATGIPRPSGIPRLGGIPRPSGIPRLGGIPRPSGIPRPGGLPEPAAVKKERAAPAKIVTKKTSSHSIVKTKRGHPQKGPPQKPGLPPARGSAPRGGLPAKRNMKMRGAKQEALPPIAAPPPPRVATPPPPPKPRPANAPPTPRTLIKIQMESIAKRPPDDRHLLERVRQVTSDIEYEENPPLTPQFEFKPTMYSSPHTGPSPHTPSPRQFQLEEDIDYAMADDESSPDYFSVSYEEEANYGGQQETDYGEQQEAYYDESKDTWAGNPIYDIDVSGDEYVEDVTEDEEVYYESPKLPSTPPRGPTPPRYYGPTSPRETPEAIKESIIKHKMLPYTSTPYSSGRRYPARSRRSRLYRMVESEYEPEMSPESAGFVEEGELVPLTPPSLQQRARERDIVEMENIMERAQRQFDSLAPTPSPPTRTDLSTVYYDAEQSLMDKRMGTTANLPGGMLDVGARAFSPTRSPPTPRQIPSRLVESEVADYASPFHQSIGPNRLDFGMPPPLVEAYSPPPRTPSPRSPAGRMPPDPELFAPSRYEHYDSILDVEIPESSGEYEQSWSPCSCRSREEDNSQWY